MTKDLAVIRLQPTATERRGHRQEFTLGDTPLAIGGIQALVQMVTLGLMSRPGSSALLPQYGVDFPGLIAKAGSSGTEHRASAIMAVSVLRGQIFDLQAAEDMPDDERLADLSVLRIFREGQRWVHHIRVVSSAGAEATLNTKEVFLGS